MQLTEGDDVVITDASQPNKLKVGFLHYISFAYREVENR